MRCVTGYREDDARELIDECDELAKRAEDVVKLVRTVADNPEAFRLLSVSRKRLAQSIQVCARVCCCAREAPLASFYVNV